jgi:hypothetical protein
VYQRLIPTDERCGLLTHIVTTESVSLGVLMEKLTAFMELELGQTCTANRQRRKRDPLAQDDSRVSGATLYEN